jgi:hypothetical protein
MAVPLGAKEKRHVRAGASNEHLDQVLSEIRQQAACVRDELFEAVIRPRGEPAAEINAGRTSSLRTTGRAALRPRRARGWHIAERRQADG